MFGKTKWGKPFNSEIIALAFFIMYGWLVYEKWIVHSDVY
jgi:hypothetical protein